MDGEVVAALVAVVVGEGQRGSARAGAAGGEGDLEGSAAAGDHGRGGQRRHREVRRVGAAHGHLGRAGQGQAHHAVVGNREGAHHRAAGHQGAAEVRVVRRAGRGGPIEDAHTVAGDVDFGGGDLHRHDVLGSRRHGLPRSR